MRRAVLAGFARKSELVGGGLLQRFRGFVKRGDCCWRGWGGGGVVASLQWAVVIALSTQRGFGVALFFGEARVVECGEMGGRVEVRERGGWFV